MKLSRRDMVKRSLVVVGAAFAGPSLIGCGDAAVSCNDTSGLSDAEKSTRSSLEYVEKTPTAAENCANCNFYTGSKSACGTCTLVKGPINPAGYCKSYTKKA